MLCRGLTLLLLSFFSLLQVSAQGKFVLIGGGSERFGGWSDQPYQWAIDQAANKKVAILSFKTESPWLPNYFTRLGAEAAHNIQLPSTDSLVSAALCDSLSQFHLLFFKDASPQQYYSVLKNSCLRQTVRNAHLNGAVLCGSARGLQILSEIVHCSDEFTDLGASPLQNPMESVPPLHNDFLPFFAGFLFEGQFVEKGKLGQMLGQMAYWKAERQEIIHGIGIDDKTAVCVDSLGKGTVYGSGAVSLLLNDLSNTNFQLSGNKLALDSLRFVQLLAGDKFDFISWEINGGQQLSKPTIQHETGDYTLLMSGSDPFSENGDFLQALVQHVGDSSDQVLIISELHSESLEIIKTLLIQNGAKNVDFLNPAQIAPMTQAKVRIESANKFLFTGNDPGHMLTFVSTNPVGQFLNQQIRKNGAICAFMGDDSRLAGRSMLVNYRNKYASYDGRLAFQPGLALLQTTMVQANSFLGKDFYENSFSGLPYGMLQDSLAYGLWLSAEMYVRYTVVNGRSFLTSYGKSPLLLLQNKGCDFHFAPPYNGISRNIAGFSQLQLSVLDSVDFPLGDVQAESESQWQRKDDWMSVYPNPVRDHINIFFYGQQEGNFTFQLVDGQGKSHYSHTESISPTTQHLQLPVPNLPSGVYNLIVRQNGEGEVKRIQLIH